MFCPNCKAEYRPGFAECADCRVALVDELPAQDQFDPNIRFVKVLETPDNADIAQIKGSLDAAGIRYFIQGENVVSLLSTGPAAVMVVEEDAPEAVELLKDLTLNYNRYTLAKPKKGPKP